MVEEATRTIAFICPSCRQTVIMERSVFRLAASRNQLPCPCGKSALEIELQGDHLLLSIPCLFCEQTHKVTCSLQAFLHEKTLAFSCAASGLDCCYVGEEGAVFAATRRLEETVNGLESSAAADGVFLNDIVMEEILAELCEIGKRDGIACTCGSRDWKMQVNYSSVEIFCGRCQAALKIPAATLSDVDDLCCKQTLTIRGKKK